MEHHAICYVGIEGGRQALAQCFAVSDPDIHVIERSEFSIDEARKLAQQASMAPMVAAEQTFVIVSQTLTHEAQNALLKLFEEPPARTRFYLLIAKRGNLLPTLQSRLMFVDGGELSAGALTVFSDFMTASLGVRLEQVADLSKTKDTEAIEAIVAGAEELAQRDAQASLMETVLLVRNHLGRRGASAKLLLESLALALPQK